MAYTESSQSFDDSGASFDQLLTYWRREQKSHVTLGAQFQVIAQVKAQQSEVINEIFVEVRRQVSSPHVLNTLVLHIRKNGIALVFRWQRDFDF